MKHKGIIELYQWNRKDWIVSYEDPKMIDQLDTFTPKDESYFKYHLFG